MKMVFEELSPRFERETGNRLAVSLGPSLVLEKRLTEGEAADVAIVTGPGAEELVGQRQDRCRKPGRRRALADRRCRAEGRAAAGSILGRGLQTVATGGKIDCAVEAGRRRRQRRAYGEGVRATRHYRSDASQGQIRRRRRRGIGRSRRPARRSRYRHSADGGAHCGFRHRRRRPAAGGYSKRHDVHRGHTDKRRAIPMRAAP